MAVRTSSSRRAARAPGEHRPAFSLPVAIAAGLVRWDAIAMRPVPRTARRARRSGA